VKALWLENRQLSLRDVPQPDAVAKGEALVRVRLSGICGTDLELVRGYYPFTGIIGHEFVGEVVDSPNRSWIGARVVAEINDACGICSACRAGRPTHCEGRTVLGITERDGVHAEYVSIPTKCLRRVPDSVSDEAAVFTEPLAAAVEITEQVHLAPSDRVLLVGAGRLGQLIAQVLPLSGVQLDAVAKHDVQRELLQSRGIRTLRPFEVDPRSYDVVIEATGSPDGLEIAKTALRPRGTLVLKSTYRGEVMLPLSEYVVDEITVVGSRCGPFEPALRLLEAGLVDPTPLIAERFPLADAVAAMERAGESGVMKVLLDPLGEGSSETEAAAESAVSLEAELDSIAFQSAPAPEPVAQAEPAPIPLVLDEAALLDDHEPEPISVEDFIHELEPLTAEQPAELEPEPAEPLAEEPLPIEAELSEADLAAFSELIAAVGAAPAPAPAAPEPPADASLAAEAGASEGAEPADDHHGSGPMVEFRWSIGSTQSMPAVSEAQAGGESSADSEDGGTDEA
jgi:threonine dehydrogenase-like Zn-dependent dehydrogenase